MKKLNKKIKKKSKKRKQIRIRRNPDSNIAQQIIDALNNPNYYTLTPLLKSESLIKHIIKNLLSSKIIELKVDESFQKYDPSKDWVQKPFWTLYFLEVLFEIPDGYRANKLEKKYFLIGGIHLSETKDPSTRKINKFEWLFLEPEFYQQNGYKYEVYNGHNTEFSFIMRAKFGIFLKDAYQHYKLGKEYKDILTQNTEIMMNNFKNQVYGVYKLE